MSSELLRTPPAIRTIHADEAGSILQQVHGWTGMTGLASTYPQVFHPRGRSVIYGMFANDTLVSHAARIDVDITTTTGALGAVLIGSVATAPEARRNGFASDVVRHIVKCGAEAGRDVALLWSDQWSFYQKIGFQPDGVQYEVELQRGHGTLAAGLRPAQAGDLPAILDLHGQKPQRVERDLGDLALLLSASPMTTMVLERQGKPVAYGCYGKGLDFDGWWHEVGGSNEDVATLLLGAMTALGQERATVMLPIYRRELLQKLDGSIASLNEGIGALRLPITPRGRTELFLDGLDSI